MRKGQNLFQNLKSLSCQISVKRVLIIQKLMKVTRTHAECKKLPEQKQCAYHNLAETCVYLQA